MSQLVLPSTDLPDPAHPPTRISIGASQYRLVAPQFVKPPLPGSVKVSLNWTSVPGPIAKNITYLQGPTTVDTSQTSLLSTLADAVMAAVLGGSLQTSIASEWTLSSVTCKDNGAGSGNIGSSTHAPIPGVNSGLGFPPQVAIVGSWSIAASYRGGKPRWYLPGVPASAVLQLGSAQLSPSFASGIQVSLAAIRTALQGFLVSGQAWNLGTISYQTGHAARPTPLFRLFTGVRVHERLDSQRRRSGKESSYPSVP